MVTYEQSADKQVVLDFIQRAKDFLRERNLLGEPGAVLYSTCETLKQGDYYFLGVNPAGSGEDNPTTIEDSLDKLGTSEENEYLDVSWYPDKDDKRRRPLQERFRFLFEDALGVENPRSICASNLIFRSSKKEKDSGRSPMAEKCWPVHELIIRDVVRPRVIITHGSLPFDFISHKLGGQLLNVPQDCKHGKWTWRCSRLETGQKLIGLPHLSIFAINSSNRTDVVREIVKQIQFD